MNTMSFFYGRGGERTGALEHRLPRGGADEVARGTIAATARAARLAIHRGQKSAGPIRMGMSLTDRDRTGRWEHWVFVALWLCGLFSVGYCLKTVLSLPWPG